MRPESRRKFLRKMFAAGATSSPAVWRSFSRRKRRDKPNLLFIWTDEQRADTLLAYGNAKIKSPNLSRLAGESVVFQNAYVSQPVCTPSRATVMTGLWPHQSGCTQNNVALNADTPVFPELLKDDDYFCGYFGKWHLGDEVFSQHGFREWRSIEDMYWPYFRDDKDVNTKSDYCNWLKELGYKPDTDRDDFSRGFAARLPLEHSKPKFLENQTCDFLRHHRHEPFVLFVNFLEPHMPFTGPLNHVHNPNEVELPINFDDPVDEYEPLFYQKKAEKFQGKYGEFNLAEESEWRRLIAHYWGLVSQVDISVGAILAELERLDLTDNTIVVFTSDHGDMMGSHRLVEKSVMYQEALRVPWMMRVPMRSRKQVTIAGHVSHIDMVPTLLELMQGTERDDLPGRSLVPYLEGKRRQLYPVYVEWNAPQEMAEGRNPAGQNRDPKRVEGPSSRAIITQDGWKLCIHKDDKNQLFHIARDPGEKNNLYRHKEHALRIRRMEKQLFSWQKSVQDELDLITSEG